MVCAYTRPRYQVSVYRTIGPLVFRLFFSVIREDSMRIKQNTWHRKVIYRHV